MTMAWLQPFMVLAIFSKNELFGWMMECRWAGRREVSFAHRVIEIHDALSE
jgi:hypothetical protein